MKIAIIGSGISGLGAAYLLHPRHDITLYEKEADVGGHSRTIDIETADGKIPVDTGFIVFNRRNYPRLCTLFEQLEVPVAKSSMSFGVSIDGGWFEYGTERLVNLFAQKRNLGRLAFYRMLLDIMRFNRCAKQFIQTYPSATVRECLQGLRLGEWFQHYYLLAMGGAIWSTPAQDMLTFPAKTMVQFFDNHGLLTVNDQPQWYTVKGGSREYVRLISAGFRDNIRCHCPVERVERNTEQAIVYDAKGNAEKFDQVIFACHSDQALRLIAQPSNQEREILGDIRYQSNQVYVHCDTQFMPKQRSAWSSWVYLSQSDKGRGSTMCLSYWMNNLQPLTIRQPIIVTLNPAQPPSTELIYDQHAFEHPLFDQAAISAQEKLYAIQGRDRFWFCGAWQRYGFHEDGLNSAVIMAKKIDPSIRWAA